MEAIGSSQLTSDPMDPMDLIHAFQQTRNSL